jgi:hypothetical protein
VGQDRNLFLFHESKPMISTRDEDCAPQLSLYHPADIFAQGSVFSF